MAQFDSDRELEVTLFSSVRNYGKRKQRKQRSISYLTSAFFIIFSHTLDQTVNRNILVGSKGNKEVDYFLKRIGCLTKD